jgi:hypothetical protein
MMAPAQSSTTVDAAKMMLISQTGRIYSMRPACSRANSAYRGQPVCGSLDVSFNAF